MVRVAAEGEKIEADAVWLLTQLRPFAEGGQLENLGRQSEFDIRNAKVGISTSSSAAGRSVGTPV